VAKAFESLCMLVEEHEGTGSVVLLLLFMNILSTFEGSDFFNEHYTAEERSSVL
jgi:hypothetical protein